MNYTFVFTVFITLYFLNRYYKSLSDRKENKNISGIRLRSTGCFKNIDYDKIPGRVYEIVNNNDWKAAISQVMRMYPDIIKYIDIHTDIKKSSIVEIAFVAYLLGYRYLFTRKTKYDTFGEVREIWSEKLPEDYKTGKSLVSFLNQDRYPLKGTCKFDTLKKDSRTGRKVLSLDTEGDDCCGYVCMTTKNGKRVPDTFTDKDGKERQIMCGGADYDYIGDSRWEIIKIEMV